MTATANPLAPEVIAKALQELVDAGGIKAVTDAIKALEEKVGPLDGKAIVDQVEKLRAGHESFAARWRRNANNGPLAIAGLGEYEDKFRLSRVFHGQHKKDLAKFAPLEHEVLKQYREKVAQVAGLDEKGGLFIPDQVLGDVIPAVYTQSAWVALDGTDGTTRVTVIEGLLGQTVKIKHFKGGCIAYWVGEREDVTPSAADVSEIELTRHKLGAGIIMSEEIAEFGGYGFEQLVRQDLRQALAKKLDQAVPYGFKTGKNAPLGIVNTKGVRVFSAQKNASGFVGAGAVGDDPNNTTNFQATWAGAELGFDGLDDMKLAFETDDITEDASFSWMANPAYFRRLAKIKVENYSGQVAGQPYLLGMPMLTQAKLAEVIGPFGKSNLLLKANKAGASFGATEAASTAKFGDVFGGNLREVVVGRWGVGLHVTEDEGKGLGFWAGEWNTRVVMYCDATVRQGRAIIFCPDARILA